MARLCYNYYVIMRNCTRKVGIGRIFPGFPESYGHTFGILRLNYTFRLVLFVMSDYGYIARNFENLNREIAALGEKYGRKITLVCVTKSGTDEELVALVRAGAADIGENRPQELVRRGRLLSDLGLFPRLHEIGNLQTNKVKTVLSASLIHSVGKLSLAEEISKRAQTAGISVPVLIEVNCAGEENKGGVSPEGAEELLLKIKELPGILPSGLMTMGPETEDGELLRPYFRKTRELFDYLNEKYGFYGGGTLSMGMTHSYKVAIEEGATLVRVGRKLFEKGENQDV